MVETIRSYIDKNLPNLNWNILPQIFEENNVELTEEIEKYLKETPGNTNWNVFEGMSGNREESWPKLIYLIYDEGWKMANDSDFSSISEAYNFIKDNWNVGDSITSDYIMLNVGGAVINTYCRVDSNMVWWDENNMIYELSENSFYSYYDD